ncbi:hypothetical protein N8Z80_03065 [Litorivicinus sp.]|nr:hypothetical protein [Litorivicinus sp.]MDC1239999.1 hypothetical protein [Litorivicinus sp.]
MTIRVVIASYIFPPRNGPGSDRVYAYAKYLSEHGFNVTVFAPESAGNLSYPMTGFSVIRVGKSSAIVGGSIKRLSFPWLRKVAQKLALTEFYRMLPWFSSRRDESSWLADVQIAIEKFIIQFGCDLLLTSHPPSETIRLGSRIKQNFPNLHWVIDYRDLYSRNHMADYFPFVKLLLEAIEKNCLRSADAIIIASESFLVDQESLLPKGIKKIVIYNGFFRLPRVSGVKSEKNRKACVNKLVLAYTGALYNGKRDIETLLRFVGSSPSYFLNLVLFSHDEKRLVERLLDRCGVRASSINIRVNLSREETLKIQNDSDMLVVLLRKDGKDRSYPTAKLFEYISSGKPILGFGVPDSEASKILTKLNAGIFFSDIPTATDLDRLKNMTIKEEELTEYLRRSQVYNLISHIEEKYK